MRPRLFRMMPSLNTVALNDKQVDLVAVVDSALHMFIEDLNQRLRIVFESKAINNMAEIEFFGSGPSARFGCKLFKS